MEAFFRAIAIFVFCSLWFGLGAITLFGIHAMRNRNPYNNRRFLVYIVLACISSGLELAGTGSLWLRNTLWMQDSLFTMIMLIVISWVFGAIMGNNKGRFATSRNFSL